jgi:hypothetical protein
MQHCRSTHLHEQRVLLLSPSHILLLAQHAQLHLLLLSAHQLLVLSALLLLLSLLQLPVALLSVTVKLALSQLCQAHQLLHAACLMLFPGTLNYGSFIVTCWYLYKNRFYLKKGFSSTKVISTTSLISDHNL